MYDTFRPFRVTSSRVELHPLSPIEPPRIYRHFFPHRSPFGAQSPSHLACRGIRLAQLPGLDRIPSERRASMVSERRHQGQEKYGFAHEKPGRVELTFHYSGSTLPLRAPERPIPLLTCRDADETVDHEFHLRKGRRAFRVERRWPRLRPVSPIAWDAGCRRTDKQPSCGGHRYTASAECLSKKETDLAKKTGKMAPRFRANGTRVPFRAVRYAVWMQGSFDSSSSR